MTKTGKIMESFIAISGCDLETTLAFLAYEGIFKIVDINSEINFKKSIYDLGIDAIEYHKMKKVFKGNNLYYKYKVARALHGNIIERVYSFIPYCNLRIQAILSK